MMKAVSRKTRRQIEVGGRQYLWWLFEEWEDFGPVTVAVASADKRFLVRYQINQPESSRSVTVMGRDFVGLPDNWSGWARVRCPALITHDAVKPSDVRRLIEWCLRPKTDVVQLDWDGHELLAR